MTSRLEEDAEGVPSLEGLILRIRALGSQYSRLLSDEESIRRNIADATVVFLRTNQLNLILDRALQRVQRRAAKLSPWSSRRDEEVVGSFRGAHTTLNNNNTSSNVIFFFPPPPRKLSCS